MSIERVCQCVSVYACVCVCVTQGRRGDRRRGVGEGRWGGGGRGDTQSVWRWRRGVAHPRRGSSFTMTGHLQWDQLERIKQLGLLMGHRHQSMRPT